MSSPVLQAVDLRKSFSVQTDFFGRTVKRLRAIDGVSFTISRGEVVGLVGESGCGKSTIGRALLRLIEIDGGEIRYDGTRIDTLSRREFHKYRKKIQIIFQDPFSSLNPRMNVKDIILEPIHNFIGNASAADNARKVRELLDIVNLPEGSGDRKPHEFSGGQRQRIGIARALSVDPEIIVCDEAVSALDVSVQAQILNLIMRLQTEKNISILFISHDLTVVERISDRIAVMYLGKIVEIGNKSQVFSKPNHPYTNALLSAVPQPDPHTKAARIILKGDVPSAVNPPSGCRFRTRCRHAMPVCAIEEPKLVQVGADHFSACHLNDGSGGGDRVPERGMQHAS